MTEGLRDRNARLRAHIVQVLEEHPELQEPHDFPMKLDVTDHRPGDSPEQQEQKEITFHEEEQAYLRKRARAIIRRRPDLGAHFEGLFPEK